MDPEEMRQWAELGKAVYNALPDEAKTGLTIPPSKSLGKGLGSIMDIIFYKPNSWALSLNNKLVQKAKLLEQETIPKIESLKKNGRYTEDCSGLAIKAIETSKYSLDSEILRSYFSELIANSLDKTKNNRVSPYFATILSNLTEDDALFLHRVKTELGNVQIPITSIVWEKSDFSTHTYKKDLCIWRNGKFSENQKTLAVLSSFGIIELDRHSILTCNHDLYQSIEKHPEYIIASTMMIQHQYEKQIHQDGRAIFTDLGQSFMNMVVV